MNIRIFALGMSSHFLFLCTKEVIKLSYQPKILIGKTMLCSLYLSVRLQFPEEVIPINIDYAYFQPAHGIDVTPAIRGHKMPCYTLWLLRISGLVLFI